MHVTSRELTEDRFRRRLNESIRATHTTRARLDHSMPAWVCECANENCLEAVNLTVPEYDAVRAGPAQFLVAPSIEHVLTGVERVVERHERYWVVEETVRAAALGEPSTRPPT